MKQARKEQSKERPEEEGKEGKEEDLEDQKDPEEDQDLEEKDAEEEKDLEEETEGYYGVSSEEQLLMDEDSLRPLIVACFEGHVSVVEWLLQQGAEVNNPTSEDKSALFAACL